MEKTAKSLYFFTEIVVDVNLFMQGGGLGDFGHA